MSLRLWIAAAIVPATLIALYVIWWFYLASSVDRAATAWIEAQRAHGLEIVMTNRQTDGFPFAVRLTAQDVRLQQKNGPTLALPQLAAEAGTLSIANIAISAPGGMSLTVPSANGGSAGRVDAKGVNADLSLRLQGGLDSLTVRATDIDYHNASAPDVVAGTLSSATAVLKLEGSDAEEKAVIDLDAALLALNPAAEVHETVDSITAHVQAVPLPAGFSGGDMAAWRSAGGKLVLDSVAVKWGEALFVVDGALNLDDRLQPAGQLFVHPSGKFDGIDRLAEQGLFDRRVASILKAGLDVQAKADAEAAKLATERTGTAPATAAKPQGGMMFNIANRAIFYNIVIPLATLPQISWP